MATKTKKSVSSKKDGNPKSVAAKKIIETVDKPTLSADKQKILQIKWLSPSSNTGFSYLAGINRPVIPNHVSKLAESISKMGVIRPVVISELQWVSGKKENYIIDGQHLYNACIRNNCSIPYIKVNIKDKQELVETIALLNASSKSWGIIDYVNAWGSLNPDYIKLNEYFNIYDIDMATLCSILSNNLSEGGADLTRLKKGKFKILNEEENVKLLNYVTDVIKAICETRVSRILNRYIVREYIRFVRLKRSKYNHKVFISALKKNKDLFKLATQETDKLLELFESCTKE